MTSWFLFGKSFQIKRDVLFTNAHNYSFSYRLHRHLDGSFTNKELPGENGKKMLLALKLFAMRRAKIFILIIQILITWWWSIWSCLRGEQQLLLHFRCCQITDSLRNAFCSLNVLVEQEMHTRQYAWKKEIWKGICGAKTSFKHFLNNFSFHLVFSLFRFHDLQKQNNMEKVTRSRKQHRWVRFVWIWIIQKPGKFEVLCKSHADLSCVI